MANAIKIIQYYSKAIRRLEIWPKSAALSFFTIISIPPLVLLSIRVVGVVVPTKNVLSVIQKFMLNVFPYGSERLSVDLTRLISQDFKFGWFSLLSLMISAQVLFVQLERVVNKLLHAQKNRNFIVTRLMFFVWLVALMGLLLAPIGVEMVGQVLRRVFEIKSSMYKPIASQAGFFVISFAMFYVLMLILPKERVGFMRLLKVSFGFGFLLTLGKALFQQLSIYQFARYNVLYGSLTTIILLIVWVFYFYNIFLVCVFVIGRRKDPFYIGNAEEQVNPPALGP